MAITLPDGRSQSDEVLEALRLRALHGIELGYSQTEIAQLLGVTHETVNRWWAAYSHDDLDALPKGRTGRPLGSGRFLSQEQAQHIQAILNDHTKAPEDFGIASTLWTRAAVAELIAKELKVILAVRSVGQYLKRWGYTCKKPRRQAKKQDPQEVQQWLEETYPEIERRAEEEGGEIHFCDEVGAVADQHGGRGYALEGEAPTMKVPDPHMRVSQVSTITNEGTVRFMTYMGTMSGALFVVFLSRLVRGSSRKIFLILDRLPGHESGVVDRWVQGRGEQIELFWLPRYSPELNADEYLNNELKGTVNAGGLADSREGLRSRIQEFMRRLLHLPQHVRNYFKHPNVIYAAGTEL